MKTSNSQVVFLGPKYTFSHEAALRMFPRAEYFYDSSPRNIFKRVESGEMDYGILPVENSATGIIPDFYTYLLDQDFQPLKAEVKVHITKEFYLPVYHHILTRNAMPLADVETLYTHRQPALQCADWIATHLSKVKIEYTDSTAAAAEKLDQDSKAACIGGNLLAKQCALIKLREEVQDYTRNITRFLAISSKHIKIPKNSDKTTFSLIIPDRVGSLVEALQLVAANKINLLNIKTLPVRAGHVFMNDFKDWFIVDVAGSAEESNFQTLLEAFGKKHEVVLTYKVFGSYPSGQARGKKAIKEVIPQLGVDDRIKLFNELIRNGESEKVEFKSSLRYDYHTAAANKDLGKVVAKTICGFMNSRGGYLFLGVSDEGKLLGIDPDIQLLSKKSADAFLATFYQIISDMIGKEYSQYVHPEIIELGNKKLCCVIVDECRKAAWLADANTFILFIRIGNSTRPLNPKEANEYVLSRFSSR